MKRRKFIASLGGAVAAWPLAAWAQQQAAVPLIGVLRNTAGADSAFRLEAFRAGLNEAGYADGRDVAIAYRYAEGHYDRLPSLAADLIQRRPAVLFASGNASALAAQRATSTVPIVFAVGNDPVRIGLVDSLSRPAGNITGVSFFTILIGKRLELARELISKEATVAYLADDNNPSAEQEKTELHDAARALAQRVIVVGIRGEQDLESAFASIKAQGAAAVIVAAGSFEFRWSGKLISLAAQHRLPAIYAGRELVKSGGLMSYSGSQSDAHRLAGIYCGRILKGDRPADLPVLLPSRFELVINLETAKSLGVTVPPTLLARADEVIE
jgi:putative ABC transport system substrate-binding protein